MLPNIHPACASLPVALLLGAAIAALLACFGQRIFWQKVACFCCCLACCGVVAAFFSGYYAADAASEAQQEFIATHHSWGKLLLWLSILSTLISILNVCAKHYQRVWRWSFNTLLLFTLLLAAYTAYLGGSLVFEHAIGVEARK